MGAAAWNGQGEAANGEKPVLVVVSHYNARPAAELVALLDAMQSVPAGWPFVPRVVVNQATMDTLTLPDRHGAVEILYRPNVGFNIGAWDTGWRAPPAYDAYLFLQEECRLVRPDWVGAFVRAAGPETGLVGECLSTDWDAPWDQLRATFRGHEMPEHLVDDLPADRVTCYLHFLASKGIPPGPKGSHLQSLILFARRTTLERIGGLPVGRNYGEAIAAEIAISKSVEALGLRIREIGPAPFTYIEHPQWLHRRSERSGRT